MYVLLHVVKYIHTYIHTTYMHTCVHTTYMHTLRVTIHPLHAPIPYHGVNNTRPSRMPISNVTTHHYLLTTTDYRYSHSPRTGEINGMGRRHMSRVGGLSPHYSPILSMSTDTSRPEEPRSNSESSSLSFHTPTTCDARRSLIPRRKGLLQLFPTLYQRAPGSYAVASGRRVRVS